MKKYEIKLKNYTLNIPKKCDKFVYNPYFWSFEHNDYFIELIGGNITDADLLLVSCFCTSWYRAKMNKYIESSDKLFNKLCYRYNTWENLTYELMKELI